MVENYGLIHQNIAGNLYIGRYLKGQIAVDRYFGRPLVNMSKTEFTLLLCMFNNTNQYITKLVT